MNLSGVIYNNQNEARACTEQPDQHNSEVQSYLTVVLLTVSVACLILHIIIHILIPKLRNLIVFSLSCAVLASQVLFIISVTVSDIGQFCALLGALLHWFFLSSFFWLNVISFDIWRTLSRKKLQTEPCHSTFRHYSLYAWGCPTLIVTGALVVHFTSDSSFSPNYGAIVCWISNRNALVVFFALPVAFLLMANTGLFISTNLTIVKRAKVTRIIEDVELEALSEFIAKKNDQKHKQQLVICVKLSVIMGLSWLFDLIASMTGVQTLWYLFILFNGLQGLFILLAFSLKEQTRRLLRQLTSKLSKPRSIQLNEESYYVT